MRAPVIDIAKYCSNGHAKIYDIASEELSSLTLSGNDARDYCDEVSTSLDLKCKAGAFTGSLSTKFSRNYQYSSGVRFGSFFALQPKHYIQIDLTDVQVQDYLSREFLNALISAKGRRLSLIQIYGTHVLSNVVTGGRIELFCQTGFDSTCTVDKITVDLESWTKSLETENYSLIALRAPLVPLADLVPRTDEFASIRDELEKAINRYLLTHAVNLRDDTKIVPLLRYDRQKTEATVISNFFNRSVADARVIDEDHLYTIDWDELQNGRDGYKYEGIVGYVYSPEAGKAKNKALQQAVEDAATSLNEALRGAQTIGEDEKRELEATLNQAKDEEKNNKVLPLYRLYYEFGENRRDHFYTTDRSEIVANQAYHIEPTSTTEEVYCYIWPCASKQAFSGLL